jgi:CheY-like chemotaxis protein
VTVIGGYGSLLIREPRLPASVKSKLQEIDDAGRRAAQLTGQLLAFASKHVRQPSLMDVNGVIGGIEPVLRSVLGDAIELRLQLQQAPGVVHTDVGGLEQVLLNLAANARDAMDHAGVLEIATSTMPGGSIAIAMTDHGCGMTPETRSRIFEPYFTTKGTGKGAGMGLSIAYGIVKAAGGQITVESAVSRGSTFRVILPLFEPGTPDPARAIKARTDLFTPVSAAVEKKSALCRHETILLVEDQEQMRELVLAVLEPHGYYILAAGSAGEAIELCAAHEGPIDLLLTDIQMPDVSGTELARMMYESYPQMKTIYMSGSEDWGRGPQTRDPNAFLLKPFHPKDLAEKVREVLDLSTSPSVLVVDDDPQIRSLLRNVLGEAGYSVEEAHGGRQALDRVRQKMPDLLITDLIMPEMEGMETITRIRKAAPRLKIIAMSGCVDSLYLDTARMLGAHATFAKPLALDALLAAVSGLLHQPATVA